ncbi:MAG: hypothetical protein H7327_05485 [Herminiimonas sp.]|nr:hypothetical protein [Herminiimonas sp.]
MNIKELHASACSSFLLSSFLCRFWAGVRGRFSALHPAASNSLLAQLGVASTCEPLQALVPQKYILKTKITLECHYNPRLFDQERIP